MTSLFRPVLLAAAFAATALPASAQTWVYEQDTPRAGFYEPRYQQRYYEPPTYDSRAYEPVVTVPPVVTAPPLTPAQRTTIYRTIIPQGRGPIVKERIVTETVPVPAVRERVVTPPAVSAYAYPVGSRVTDAYALAPLPQSVVATVPAVRSYRYMVINNRLLLVDPATGFVVAEVTE